jgi:HEAT repeat protein
VAEGKRELEKYEKVDLKPALSAFTGPSAARGDLSTTQALRRSIFDRDAEVRLNARRTLIALGLVRASLIYLRKSIPIPKGKVEPEKKDRKGKEEDEKDKEDRKDGDARARPGKEGRSSVRIIQTAGTEVPARLPVLQLPPPRRDEDNKGKDKPLQENDRKGNEKKTTGKKQEGENNWDEALNKLLLGLDRDIAARCADPDPVNRRRGLMAIEALGDEASIYLDRILAGTKDRDLFVRWIAARTLGKLAEDRKDRTNRLTRAQTATALRALVCLLDDDDLDVRLATAKAIGLFGPAGSAAVAALTKHVNRGDAEFRMEVMRALEGIGESARTALPAIARELRELDPRLRAEAARVIGRFGPAARAYLPALMRLNDDPDSDVRSAASAAILNITQQPENGTSGKDEDNEDRKKEDGKKKEEDKEK